jgi:phosphopantothenoylcysteine synthetase/decarboxylase
MADDVESQLGDDCRGIIRTEWSRRRRMGQSASDLEDNNDHQHGGDAATGHTVIRHEPRVVAETSDDDDEDQAWSVAGGKRIVATGRADDDLPPVRVVTLKDNGGRDLPVAERAPMPLGRRG